jgi:adhesin/invasin
MHYRTALGGPAQTAGLPSAAAPFANIVYKPANVLVNRATLPASTEVWVMQPQSDAAAVSAAGFAPGAPAAPGSIVSLFGPFTGSATSGAGYPLPRKLVETEAWIDGKPAPLFYVSPGQINLQVPAAQAPGQALVEARVNGQTLARAPLTIVPNAPGLFAVANKDGSLNSAGAPARRGEIMQIFGTGQGGVFPAVDDGAPALVQPSANTYGPPNVFLENRQLTVQSSALAAGVAGVWQITAVIPADAPVGDALSLVVIQGLTSNRIAVAVSQ